MTRFGGSRLVRWLRLARSALLVEAGLRTFPLDRLASALGIALNEAAPPPPQVRGAADFSPEVRWAFDATDRLLHLLPGRSRCLRRALIAGHLLRAHKPSLQIGGARHEGELKFHAWLELDGAIAADPEALRYRRFVRARSAN